MAQGGAERGERPAGGESLLKNPHAIIKRIEDLETEGLEKFARLALPIAHRAHREFTEEERVDLSRFRDEIKKQARSNFVRWIQEGWREIDEKISAVPYGEERQIPDFSTHRTYSDDRRALQVDEATSITEQVKDSSTRVVTIKYRPKDGDGIDVDFTVWGSELRRVGFNTEREEIQGLITLGGREVRVRFEEVSDFSFPLPAAESVPAAP